MTSETKNKLKTLDTPIYRWSSIVGIITLVVTHVWDSDKHKMENDVAYIKNAIQSGDNKILKIEKDQINFESDFKAYTTATNGMLKTHGEYINKLLADKEWKLIDNNSNN